MVVVVTSDELPMINNTNSFVIGEETEIDDVWTGDKAKVK